MYELGNIRQNNFFSQVIWYCFYWNFNGTTQCGSSHWWFYFDETDVDKVSYVNGKVFIISKSDLSIKNKINLDYRPTGLALANDVLVVSGLYNVKFYDVSHPNKPKHLYTYQPSFERDMQGVTTFNFAGHTYAFVCCYSTGFLIWDITDKTNIHKVSDEDFSDVIYNGSSIKSKLNCFSCVVDYPYAYLTISSTPYYVPTHKNAAGVLTLNISDFPMCLKNWRLFRVLI